MEGPQDLHLPHPCSHTKHACQPRETQERSGGADEIQTAVTVRPGALDTESSDAPRWPEDHLWAYMKSPVQPVFLFKSGQSSDGDPGFSFHL